MKNQYTQANADESYKAYKQAQYNYEHALDTFQKGMDWWLHRKMLEEAKKEAIYNIFPEVGRGATIYYWSDRRAATITKVELTKAGQPKAVEVAFNEVKCTDYYAGDYEILPELNTAMGTRRFTRRRNGRWYEEGQETNPHSVELMLHYQHHYIDPSF